MCRVVNVLLVTAILSLRSTDALYSYCDPPDPLPHAHLDKVKDQYTGGGTEDTVTYKCDSGYWAEEQRQVRCTFMYIQWHVVVKGTACKALCPPPAVQHGRVQPNKVHFVEGDNVTISCRWGYKISGTSDRQSSCKEKTWQPTLPQCTGLCPPPAVQHGRVEPTKELYVEGDNVTIFCQWGYKISGTSGGQSSCKERTWQPTLPQCTADRQSTFGPEETHADTHEQTRHTAHPPQDPSTELASTTINEEGHTKDHRHTDGSAGGKGIAIAAVAGAVAVSGFIVGSIIYFLVTVTETDTNGTFPEGKPMLSQNGVTAMDQKGKTKTTQV